MPNLINNISTLPSEVQTLLNDNSLVVIDSMTQGMPWINEHFTVIENDGRTPLWNIEVLDFLRPAGQDWLPVQALKYGAKVPVFEDIDADLEIPRSQIIEMARSHVKHLANAGTMRDAINMHGYAYSFVELVSSSTGKLIEQKGLFKGVRSAAVGAQGAGLSLNGMNFRITAGVASGDIPASNVYTSPVTALDAAGQYNEVKEICQKTESNVTLDGTPLNYYLSPKNYRLYKQGRRAANPNTVGPNDSPETVDDFEHIKFVVSPGLSGSDKQYINKKENQFFAMPDSFVASPLLTVVNDVKVYKTNLFTSAWIGYNFGKIVFTNTRN
jgi:hypothetical protein